VGQNAQIGDASMPRHDCRCSAVKAAPFGLDVVLMCRCFQCCPQSLCGLVNRVANVEIEAVDSLRRGQSKLRRVQLLALAHRPFLVVKRSKPAFMAARQICRQPQACAGTFRLIDIHE
jgi:hypothetical protein